MKRLVRSLLILLGGAYAVAGVVFLSTGNPGGISLGLLFLGGLALLYFLMSLQTQLGQMHELLALLAIRSQSATSAKLLERAPDAPNLEREKNPLEPAVDPAASPGV